jgi:ring-1,2-phenylacetyl-CoA epoxidase subunit PaaC
LAQDKVGHAYNIYQLAEPLMGMDPDKIAFTRGESAFKCAHFTELPNQGYDVTLMRHFLFDHSEFIRYDFLMQSSNEDLAITAKKFKSEIKYHIFHANTWIKQLAQSNDSEVLSRLQNALNFLYPYALGLFEPSKFEDTIIAEKLFVGEDILKSKWIETTSAFLTNIGLIIPVVEDEKIHYGGRQGYHSEHLSPLLTEMREVYSSDEGAEW